MNNYEFAYNGKAYKQVNKTTARKLYIAGTTVVMCASRLRPETFGFFWNRAERAEYIRDDIGARNDFDNLLASFEYYNLNVDCGKYTRFYAEV